MGEPLIHPWFKKKCSKRRRKWLENTIARRFHPWRYHPTLSSKNSTFFLCWGGEVERSTRLKRRKITTAAAWRSSSPPLSLPSPPVSLGLTFTHRRIYFLPPVARQQTGKSITWRRQILRKSSQEGDASGRCSMKKRKRRKKTKQSESLSFSLCTSTI